MNAGVRHGGRPILHAHAFSFQRIPFDCLTPDEQRLVRASVDIAYSPEGAVVLDAGSAPTHLFVIIKGYVTQTEGEEVRPPTGPRTALMAVA